MESPTSSVKQSIGAFLTHSLTGIDTYGRWPFTSDGTPRQNSCAGQLVSPSRGSNQQSRSQNSRQPHFGPAKIPLRNHPTATILTGIVRHFLAGIDTHVAEIKKTYKGKVHVSTYLRRTFREDGKVKHETVANISDLPDDLIAVIKNRRATSQPLVGDGGTMTIHRSLPHGNVAAVLGTMRNIGLDQFVGARACRERSLVMAMIADRIISPGSKLSCSGGMHSDTAQNTLGEELQRGEVDVHELYDAMDWLLERQTRIENKLAKWTGPNEFRNCHRKASDRW